MTAVRPLQDLIVARLLSEGRQANRENRMRAMACLVSQDHAVTDAHGLQASTPSVSLSLTPNGERESRTWPATVAWIDTASDLAMLQFERQGFLPLEGREILAEILPEPGSRWEALIWGDSSEELVRVAGEVRELVTTDGRSRLQLRVVEGAPVGISNGAPVFSDGRVIGLISGFRRDDPADWYAIPSTAILQAMRNHEEREQASQRPPGPKKSSGPSVRQANARQSRNPTSSFEEAADDSPASTPLPLQFASDFFSRLSASSRRALQHADGMRLAMGQDKVHMEHLILALYEKDNGPTQRELKRVEMSEGELRAGLREILEVELPQFGSYDVRGIDQLPPVSGHVSKALVSAKNVAEANHSETVQSRHLFYGVLFVQECRAVKWLLDKRVDPTKIDMTAPPSAPGRKGETPDQTAAVKADGRPQQRARVAPDLPDGDDLLDVRREVEAICAVIAAHETSPPLSIGLFGDWGTGKSFFMNRMEERIRQLKRTARNKKDSAYCRNIVQLRFNAWHYMDTDLWASLAAEIFEGLARALEEDTELLDGQKDPTAARARLLAATSHLRGVREKAEQRKAEANAALRESEQRLASLAGEEQKIVAQLGAKQLAKAAYRFVAGQKETAKAIDEAAKKLGISDGQALASDTRATFLELKGLWGGVRAVLLSLKSGSAQLWIWLVLTFILLLSAVALLVQFSGQLVPKITALVPLLGAALAILKKIIGPTRTALSTIADARTQSKELIDREQTRRKTELRSAHEAIQQSANAEEATITRVTQEIAQLEQQLEALRADRQMADFVRAKQESTDYTKHFGVIARARSDFQQLTDLLRRVVDESTTSATKIDAAEKRPPIPKIDRIILYIDDLDRCPEAKVVDVLQAVHLLLAFPLFIVVVGVDSRWLLHSLRQQARVFKVNDEEDDGMDVEERVHWQSTPFNYLEKIFQIPFNLRSMERTGFTALVDSLTIPKVKAKAVGSGARETAAATGSGRSTEGDRSGAPSGGGNAPQQQTADPKTPAMQQSAAAPGPRGQQEPLSPERTIASAAGPERKADENQSQNETARTAKDDVLDKDEIDPNPPYLDITGAERRFMYTTYRLIPTPRAAKRYVNVYRLLRASLPDDKRATLEDEALGGFRRVLLMLAILTGSPQEGTVILRELVERMPEGSWWSFINQIAQEYIERGAQHARSENKRSSVQRKGDSTRPDAKDHSTQDVTAGNSDAEERLRAQRWQDLVDRMSKVRVDIGTELGPDPQCVEFYRWARQVARYSFEAGRVAGVDDSLSQPQNENATPTSLPSLSYIDGQYPNLKESDGAAGKAHTHPERNRENG